jgi:hypothetical protein
MTANRRKIFLVIGIFILGLIIGGAIGAYGASHFLGSFFSHGSTLSQIVAIKEKVFTLSKLREGEMEKAKESLETALDYNLIYFSMGIHGSKQMEKEIKRALKGAKEYRSRFPRTTNYPDVDKAVSDALANADN